MLDSVASVSVTAFRWDWGSGPAWAAVIIASIVGWFTSRGAIAAFRSYKEDNERRRIDQAALVYCTVATKSSIGPNFEVPYLDFDPVGSDVLGGEAFVHDMRSKGEEIWRSGSASLRELEIALTNRSAKPITRVGIAVRWNVDEYLWDLDPGSEKRVQHGSIEDVLPESARVITFYFRYDRVPASDFDVAVTFTDSAGNRWVRINLAPPVSIPPRYLPFQEVPK